MPVLQLNILQKFTMLFNPDLDIFPLNRYTAQTGLPDLTQPQYLNQIATELPLAIAIFTIIAITLGAGMALISFSQRNQPQSQTNMVFGDLTIQADRLVSILQHIVLVSVLMLSGFLFCSTLANRQNSWEATKITTNSPKVAEEIIQQTSPLVSYSTLEPYSYTTQLEGKLVKVQDNKDVTRTTTVSSSNLQVRIDPIQNKPEDRTSYSIDFKGEYQITNPITTTDKFTFQINPPSGYTLLQNFSVEQNGQKLVASPPENRYALKIAPNTIARIFVNYRAQGSPQWVYNAKETALSNFRMAISTEVPRINFISSVAPTKVETKGTQKTFNWIFERNASVQKPFGVAMSADAPPQTGALSLFLMLAPGIFLWWILLLYFSIPIDLKNVALAGFTFFISIFVFTYFSRLTNPLYVWGGVSFGLLCLVWGLGRSNWRASIAAVICTIAGVIIPVYGFSIGDRGLVISIAAIISIIWLAIRNWHGWYQLEPRTKFIDAPNPEDSSGFYPNQNIIEESTTYNQLNPANSDAEAIARQNRHKDSTPDIPSSDS